MGLFSKIAFWRRAPEPVTPLLKDWYAALPKHPSSSTTDVPITFTHEELKIPSLLNCDNLIIYNGIRSPGGTALHIEHIVIYGGKAAFRMLGMYLIAAALRIKYDEPVRIECTNKELSPCRGLKIGMPKQSKLEKSLQLAPGILTQWSWTPAIPESRSEHWVREQDDSNFPSDHLPWLRLGSLAEVYSEHHRPRSDQAIITHLTGTLPSLCWLARGLLNFALDDNPCHTWSLLNYGGHSSLTSGSAELRFVSPGGSDIPPSIASWLENQRPPAPPPALTTETCESSISLEKAAEPAVQATDTPAPDILNKEPDPAPENTIVAEPPSDTSPSEPTAPDDLADAHPVNVVAAT